MSDEAAAQAAAPDRDLAERVAGVERQLKELGGLLAFVGQQLVTARGNDVGS